MAKPFSLRVPWRIVTTQFTYRQILGRQSSARPKLLGPKAEEGWTILREYSDDRNQNKFLHEGREIRDVDPNSLDDFSESPPYLRASFGIEDARETEELVTNRDLFETSFKTDLEADVENALEDSKNRNDFDELGELEQDTEPRPPRAVQAAYLRPLRRQPIHNIPVCDLQLRSYSVRNLEFMADFALRAAYFLDLPASGPVPLPRIVERWTVPKAHFIHKKVQENFERKTLRRLIQIKDGDSEVVRLWLGFLRKHAYYGVGMKANVWEFSSLDVAKNMDTELEQNRPEIEPLLAQYAFKEGSKHAEKLVEVANQENRWQAYGGSAPMINTPDWRKPLN